MSGEDSASTVPYRGSTTILVSQFRPFVGSLFFMSEVGAWVDAAGSGASTKQVKACNRTENTSTAGLEWQYDVACT